MNDEMMEQIAVCALEKCVPYKVSKSAKNSVRPGKSHKIRFTATIDGTLAKGKPSTQSASASPLQDALLALLVRDLDADAIAAQRKAAMRIVKAAAKKEVSVAEHLAATVPAYAAIVASLKEEAAKKLPAVAKAGSLSFRGSYKLTNVRVE